MTIAGVGSGIGLNILPTRQDLASAADRNNVGPARQSDTSSEGTLISRDGSQTSTTNAAPFSPPTPGNQLNQPGQNRQNPADIEALRNQFGLQSDNAQTIPSRAIASFESVAQFEQRDEIANATGIDIFV